MTEVTRSMGNITNILLHICCGPCSLYCIDDLRAAFPDVLITGLYANPNIHPYEEFERRRESTRQACSAKAIPVEFLTDFDQKKWEVYEREDPARCEMCYRVRMERTARYAQEHGFQAFTSTLFVSPYQNHELLKAVCEEMAQKYGVSFLYRDFRPGFRTGQREAKELGLYRQKYCGCIRSLPEQGGIRMVSEQKETGIFEEASVASEESEAESDAVIQEIFETEEMDAPAAQKKQKSRNKTAKEVLSWVGTILAAILIAVFINAYVFRTSRVSGDSMQTTLQNGQTVYISRLPYLFGDPEYGDIIVFDSENIDRNFFLEVKESFQYNVFTYKLAQIAYPKKYWIKRVIGLAGDTIEIREEGVYRNGILLEETYVNPAEIPNYKSWEGKRWAVGEGEVFVMGDNRNHSMDSRTIGLILEDAILGKVVKQ